MEDDLTQLVRGLTTGGALLDLLLVDRELVGNVMVGQCLGKVIMK